MSGLRNPAVAALAAGLTIVMPDPGLLHPARLLQLLTEHEIRYLATVPALLQQLCASRERLQQEARPTRLELILTTGQAVSKEVCDEIESWLGAPVRSYYGLTETGGICTADPLQGRLAGDLGVPAGAVGQVVDGGRILRGDGSPDECGELRIFSPANMLGYWESSTVSSVSQDAGWIGTGDVVRLCADGSFELVGRRDDQVKNRHGEVLYLQELERVAMSLPEVRDACCLEQSTQGNRASGLALFVVVEDGRDATETRNRLYEEVDRSLGFKKRPDEVREVRSIRRLANGKIDRNGMLA
jgi:fatty-acyl-CoA synthase